MRGVAAWFNARRVARRVARNVAGHRRHRAARSSVCFRGNTHALQRCARTSWRVALFTARAFAFLVQQPRVRDNHNVHNRDNAPYPRVQRRATG